jgi:hypothetical protein
MLKLPNLWSLAEMIELFASRFGRAYHSYHAMMESLIVLEKEHRVKPINDRVLTSGRKSFVAETALRPMIVELEHLQFPIELCNKAKILYGRLADAERRTWTAEGLLDALTGLNGDIHRELAKHKFFKVRLNGEQYLENEYLFGSDVFEKFKTARKDIKQAGTSFSLELYTASVFHLMRVAEHGLRTLAKRLHVTVSDHHNPIPLEYADWNKVITGIKNKIDDARKQSGTKRNARLDYYSDGLERCSAMKELYRNPVSHARRTYTEGGASDAMERVRNFMQFLARPVPR